MIRLYEIRSEIGENIDSLKKQCEKLLGTSISEFKLVKRSIDARRKSDIFYSCTVDCEPIGKISPSKKLKISHIDHKIYEFPKTVATDKRIIIVGSGPAGLFSGLCLARAGFKPVIIERGSDVDKRVGAINNFFSYGCIDEETNVQFGEGGAGTFSDGKLNTGVNDIRIKFVLNEFVKYGAPENILYDAAPHIGTDILREVVKNIRNDIIKLGGSVLFNTKLTDVIAENNTVKGIKVINNGIEKTLECDFLLLAIGHSARDTMRMLYEKGLSMEKKMFSIGVRIEHRQKLINEAMFGNFSSRLPAASYKLWTHLSNGNSLYTFCMCPGGFVVNSASKKNTVVTNGMSNNARDGINANSAILVNIKYPEGCDTFAGMELQEEIEERAFRIAGGNYKAPVQLLGDFLNNTKSSYLGKVEPTIKPGYAISELSEIFPYYIVETIKLGIVDFDRKIKGFSSYDSVLTAPETRSSSPVRIIRDKENLSTSLNSVYSAGEGGGHAGGITSSAVDGIKVAEAIIKSIG